MAKGAVEGDIGDWESVDMNMIKQRFMWATESTKSGSDATLTTLKKVFPKNSPCIDKLDKGLFASETRETAKKLPWNKFKTKNFFVKMAGSEDAAQKACKQIMAEEQARQSAKGGQNAAVVDRLTDTSKYTGAHKERFDAEGKGKGASGRKDEAKNTGYVGAYKGEGTYKGDK